VTAVEELPPLLWSAEQASIRLGGAKTANWLRTHARVRDIPVTYLGKTPMWSEADLLALIEQCANPNPANYGRRTRR